MTRLRLPSRPLQARRTGTNMEIIGDITNSLGADAPPVPRGFSIHFARHDEQDVIVCRAPVDKRKSKGRVPAQPKIWILMTNTRNENFWIPENDFPTRTIREFMIAQGLQMEIKLPGFQMTNKAPKCSTILRQEYGMTGKPADLLEQFLKFRQIDLNSKGTHANMELR